MLTVALPTHQAAHRARELDRLYQTRRGHVQQISISDDNHHVTEAIGDMYGDHVYTNTDPHQQQPNSRNGRPLSFVPAAGETLESGRNKASNNNNERYEYEYSKSLPVRTPSHEKRRGVMNSDRSPVLQLQPLPQLDMSPTGSIGSPNGHSPSSNSDSPMSSPPLNRTPSEPSQQHFPLTDLDSTAAVAQELSNLQAIRRMSMDVHAADPDLPSFTSGWSVPSVAPSKRADEDDPSTLFWVPASVHPELAPKAFETFIQDRVKTIKRSSLSQDTLTPDMIPPQSSGLGLQRKKSMLSRQVNDANGYEDGAERLERKKSVSDSKRDPRMVSLNELEELAHDPAKLARRLSVDASARNSYESGQEGQQEDTPILAPKPPGQTLKRSTRTTYRRGSQRKGGPSKRHGIRGDVDDESPIASPTSGEKVPQLPALPDLGQFGGQFGLTRVQTEPTPQPKVVENFSRPGRRAKTPPMQPAEVPAEFSTRSADARSPTPEERTTSPPLEQYPGFQSRMTSNGRSTASMPPGSMPVPTIIETPPPPSDHSRTHSSPALQRPERSSSIDTPPSQPPSGPLPSRPSAQRPQLTRPGSIQQQQQSQQQSHPQPQTRDPQSRQRNAGLDQIPHNAAAIPGNNMRTDNLSFIPFADDKKTDKKGKDKKDEGPRKTSWGWLLGGEEKKKQQEEEAKRNKMKVQKPPDKSRDTTRLDVLQTSIDGDKGRESVVLDRQTIQIDPEKKPSRKPSSEAKREKDGLFSSIFGGSKKKGDKDSSSKKHAGSLRGLSPDPPQRRLQPDVDYNWSRFSILEERAIYRMAHIKLANPRRELYSQVLLSNFMYSYLAKVQQMHPQIQIPQSAAQKQQARQAQQQKKAEQQAEAQRAAQQQQQQSQQQSLQQTQQQQGGGGQQQADEFSQYQHYQEVGEPSNSHDSRDEYILD
ncbi:hypothetical protein EJ08DRAFT_65292 [Tothia fuscella]|uniref:Protein Zds1 C-terminal domain-containing protein n=1 Tax=Tothia fuscella TaxID=1048955 RepID=A0A9P4NF77_9PEZI|nr:hypothetical protein EJ08DRAFT_65292 [Tothia fuscella]